MCDTGWWRVLLDGTVGAIVAAIVAGAVAAATAGWVVSKTTESEDRRSHERAVRDRLADLLVALSQIPTAEKPRELWKAFWTLDGRIASFRVELGPEHRVIGDWAQEQLDEMFNGASSLNADPGDTGAREIVEEVADEMYQRLLLWGLEGLPKAVPPRASVIPATASRPPKGTSGDQPSQ